MRYLFKFILFIFKMIFRLIKMIKKSLKYFHVMSDDSKRTKFKIKNL